MIQPITIQNLDEETISWIDKKAHQRGMTPESLVIELIRKGIQMDQKDISLIQYRDLTDLAGVWSDEELQEFAEATTHFNEVDEELWQ